MPRIVDFDLTGTIAANDFVPLWGTDDGKTQRVLAAGFVSSGLIGVGAVESSNIANATIVAGNIANATIIANNIANATITALQIKNATITAAQIENATITAGKIKNATITAVQIENATITGSKIATATIMAGNIVDATITGGKIANATVMAGNIGNGTIIGGNIADSTITGGLLVDQTITTGKIGLLQITAAVISNLTITAGKIENGTITGGKVATSTLDKTNLNFTAFDVNVDDLDDVDDGLTYAKILTTDISAGHIKLSECTGSLDNIADGIGENSYGKVLVTDISAGHILLSECTGSLDDVDDGLTYGKVATTSISAGKIVLTLGVSGSLPVANSDAKCTDVNADQTSANETFSSEGDMELDDIAGTTKATILQTVIDTGYVKLIRLAADTTERLEITAGGVEGYANNVKNFELASGEAYLGDQANEHIKLSASGLQIYDGAVLYATYGATTTLGLVASEHISISSTAVQIKNGATVYTDLTNAILTLGDSSNEHIKVSTSGFEVKDGATVLATYGATVVIGEVGANKSNIEITAGALNLRTNETDVISISNVGVASIDINDGGNINVKAGGDIILAGSDSDPAFIKWVTDGTDIYMGAHKTSDNFSIYPATTGDGYFFIGYEFGGGGSSKPFLDINQLAKNNWFAYARNSGNLECRVELKSGAVNQSADLRAYYDITHEGQVFCYANATNGYVRINGSDLRPYAHKTNDLGLVSIAWDDAYADDWHNVADLYCLDTYNDLQTILDIKPSGEIDERTGLPLIDDDTLPDWMLTKYKQDGEIMDKDEKVVSTYKKGEIARDPDNKPWLTNKVMFSLLMGAVKELNQKIEKLKPY